MITAQNLVDEFRDREIVVSYDYPLLASLRKPIVISSSVLGLFVLTWAVGLIDTQFANKK